MNLPADLPASLPAQGIVFDQPDIAALLKSLESDGLDALDFGVIGFDQDNLVQRYNAYESRVAGLGMDRVLGQDLFDLVAPCMNNFLVAQRFVDARDNGEALDETINYVLTLRMRPTKVKLRLVAVPPDQMSYVLVHRI